MQSVLNRYIDQNKSLFPSAAYELKAVNLDKKKSFAFDQVADHQIQSLLDVEGTGLRFKIPDIPNRNRRFSIQNPFDFFLMRGNAYVVICFYKPRRYQHYHFIRIKKFIEYRDASKKKSISEGEAKAISEKYTNIPFSRENLTLKAAQLSIHL